MGKGERERQALACCSGTCYSLFLYFLSSCGWLTDIHERVRCGYTLLPRHIHAAVRCASAHALLGFCTYIFLPFVSPSVFFKATVPVFTELTGTHYPSLYSRICISGVVWHLDCFCSCCCCGARFLLVAPVLLHPLRRTTFDSPSRLGPLLGHVMLLIDCYIHKGEIVCFVCKKKKHEVRGQLCSLQQRTHTHTLSPSRCSATRNLRTRASLIQEIR